MKQLGSSTNEPHSPMPPCLSAVCANFSPDVFFLLFPRQSCFLFRTQLRPWFTKQPSLGPQVWQQPPPPVPTVLPPSQQIAVCAVIVSVFLLSPFCFSCLKCKVSHRQTMRASAGPRRSTRSAVPFASSPHPWRPCRTVPLPTILYHLGKGHWEVKTT